MRPEIDPGVVLAALTQAIVVVDEAGQVRYRNHPEIAPCFDAPSEERLADAVRDVLAQRALAASIECTTSDRAFRVDVRPCAGGALYELRDITAEKKTETALREIEERFKTLVDGSPDIVLITDASSRMLYANHALEEQTGYSVADFQMPQAENKLIHPEDQAYVTQFLAEFVASGRKYSGPLRNRFVARDGRVLWLHSVVSRSEYAGAPVLQFVVHNITEQEKAREELARIQEQLFKQERLAALGELAAIVAHEIRNPVSIIYNALTTLRKGPPQDDANVLLAIVADEAERLQRMVRDLLDFTRPWKPSFETCDLASIAQEALATVLSGRLDGGAVRVSGPACGASYVAEVDRHMIHRVVVNLIANAFQAMPNGGDLTLALIEDAGSIALSIRDSGDGIPSETAERIFEPFFTTRATGTGLGLALVKRLVEMHRGTVAAATATAGGACFTLTLPIAQSATSAFRST